MRLGRSPGSQQRPPGNPGIQLRAEKEFWDFLSVFTDMMYISFSPTLTSELD